jgi:hypothetical protein
MVRAPRAFSLKSFAAELLALGSDLVPLSSDDRSD